MASSKLTFAQWLEKQFEAHPELDEREISRLADVSQPYVNLLRRGKKKNPSGPIVVKLAKAFDAPLADALLAAGYPASAATTAVSGVALKGASDGATVVPVIDPVAAAGEESSWEIPGLAASFVWRSLPSAPGEPVVEFAVVPAAAERPAADCTLRWQVEGELRDVYRLTPRRPRVSIPLAPGQNTFVLEYPVSDGHAQFQFKKFVPQG